MKTNVNFKFECITVLLLSATTFGCTATNIEHELTQCTEPRPEICTMDYTPVCGLQQLDGVEQWKTYSNACAACSDATVAGYRKDACDAHEK
jgi:hypothetical protein